MTTFAELSLDPRVLQAVSESGYETPTPIQVQSIPHALEGRDVLGIAQTGTGKTGAFVLPMLCALSKGRARARMPRSLVLAPTRELAAQVAEQFEKYSAHLKLTMALLIGGVSFKDQDKLIDRGVDVLIATPGRLLDHFERGKLMLTGVQIMVVDEADRMLDMGFIPDIERIFKLVPFTRQTLFFSATMAPEITRITDTFLHNPVRVEVARQATTSETIDQWVVKHTPRRKDTADSEKREVLRRLIVSEGDTLTNGIIFCNRKRDVDVVAKSLKRHGFDAEAMHGDLDQKLRMAILARFREGDLKLLIASDVAARGLDIPNVSHIFNFDVPIHSEDYVHRIGRTGRAGRSGKSLTLCLPHEQKYLDKIEELVKKTIPVMESPLQDGEMPPPVQREPATERRRSSSSDRPRGEGRSRSFERTPKPQVEPAERVAVEAAPAEVRPERAEASVEAQPDNSVDVRSDSRSDARSESSRSGSSRAASSRSDSRGGRRSDHGDRHRGRSGREERVTGMGDHVPAFLMRDFRLEAGTDFADEAEAQADDVLAEIPEFSAAVEAPVASEAPVVEARAIEAQAIEQPLTEASVADAAPAAQEGPAAEAPAFVAEPRPPKWLRRRLLRPRVRAAAVPRQRSPRLPLPPTPPSRPPDRNARRGRQPAARSAGPSGVA